MSKPISSFIATVEIIDDEVRQTFGELSKEQFNWKPNPKSWSIAQCLEHLIVTNDLYFENIQKVADGTHRNNLFSKIPFVTDLIGFGMKKILSPDWKMKMKTFEMFKPSYSDVSESILEDFSKHQEKFIALMESTKDLDCREIKVAEPIGVAVNLRLIDAFEVLVVHEQRHFNQARRVLEMEKFPR